MIIERNKDQIIFKLEGNINIDDLKDLTGLFEFKEISRKSKAKQKDIDSLVKTIKKGSWETTENKLGYGDRKN